MSRRNHHKSVHQENSLPVPNKKIIKRVIAPYVQILRKGQKLRNEEKLKENYQFSHYLERKPSVLMRELSAFLLDSIDLPSLLNETSDILKITTKASGVTLYLVDQAKKVIYRSPKHGSIVSKFRINWPIREGTIVAAFVALHKECVLVDDIIDDERFPEGIGYESKLFCLEQDITVKSVLCVPIVTLDGDCFAVVELYREMFEPIFSYNDLKICVVVTGWMGAAIHQNRHRLALKKQQELNDYLLELTKCYFGDNSIMIEKMITEIVKFAKESLGAERGSFFVIDNDNNELVADLFDEGIGDNNQELYKKKVKVRFGKELGIAGLVAKTGVTVNIKDAYNDPRFNREVDKKTGFITRSILCMPILGLGGVLGVVQVVNKKNGGVFTKADEEIFKTFSVYSALALHYSKISSQLNHASHVENSLKKLLNLQVVPCIHDFEYFSNNLQIKIPQGFDEFKWYISTEDYAYMPQYILYIFCSMLDQKINLNAMMQFILSAKKLYRNQPYHNFEHAFNVLHCIYNVLKRNKKIFTEIEIKALLIGTLCHDIDHPGFSNNFLQQTHDELANLYEESTLEHHHYYVTLILLGECKIFDNFTSIDYKKMIKDIEHIILASDLSRYFIYRAKLIKICNENSFNWNNQQHRFFIKALMMTGCDLSNNAKPFPIAKQLLNNLYREFYRQGDIEKTMGLCPLSMMDRDKQYNIPDDQIQFLTIVVIPCYELLKTVLPNTVTIYNQCISLRKTWEEIISVHDIKTWCQENSIVNPNKDI